MALSSWRMVAAGTGRIALGAVALGVALGVVSLAGCTDGEGTPARGRPDRVLYTDGGPPPDANGLTNALPCDVADVVVLYCIRCHGESPATDARTMYRPEDFAALSMTDPTRTVAEIAVERMRLTNSDRMPKPPSIPVPEADIARFEAWVVAGMPAGTCGVDDPFSVPPQCTSMRMWLLGNHESPLMRPGGACIHCHETMREGPYLSLAGTVYPTAHEPDDCNGAAGASSGATVEVTDDAGRIVTMVPNAAGNFFSQATITLPITARVITSAGVREMTTPVSSGDCNSCHTQDGMTTQPDSDPAPGRIILP